jgi:hypothetical protein
LRSQRHSRLVHRGFDTPAVKAAEALLEQLA